MVVLEFAQPLGFLAEFLFLADELGRVVGIAHADGGVVGVALRDTFQEKLLHGKVLLKGHINHLIGIAETA